MFIEDVPEDERGDPDRDVAAELVARVMATLRSAPRMRSR
jgi:hypothetical protein